MITKFQLFELYRGAHKAIGFKHFQELMFKFVIITNEECYTEFKSIASKFLKYLKILGIEKMKIEYKDEITDMSIVHPELQFKGKTNIYYIGLIFPAVNTHEAISILETIMTYMKNKKIFIIKGLLISDIESIKSKEEENKKTTDMTPYLYRKEISKAAGVDPKITNFMNYAYKTKKIGF
jgi:hypothetical protein